MFHLKRYRRLVVVLVLLVVLVYQIETLHGAVLSVIGNSGYSKNMLLRSAPIEVEGKIQFDPSLIKYIPHETLFQTYRSHQIENPNNVNWEKLAYVFYATDPARLLSVLINIHQLEVLGSKAQFELIYSYEHPLNEYHKREDAWNLLYPNDEFDAQMPKDPILDLLKTKFSVNIRYLPSLYNIKSKPGQYWGDSFTKLHLWHMTEYDRIIYLDADGFIQRNMDILFFAPPSVLAAPLEYQNVPQRKKQGFMSGKSSTLSDIPPTPLENTLLLKDLHNKYISNEEQFDRAFYLKLYNALPDVNLAMEIGHKFDPKWNMRINSYVMVCTPNDDVWNWVKTKTKQLSSTSWDMELVNDIWNLNGLSETNSNFFKLKDGSIIPSVMVLPHSPYALLSGEYRKTLHEHAQYITPPIYFGSFGDPYFEKMSLRELQRTYGVDVEDIEDPWGDFDSIGLWDWAWRFSADAIKNEKKIWTRKRSIEITSDDEHITEQSEEVKTLFYAGMGLERYGWSPEGISEELYYLHWSDYPLPKPWEIFSLNSLKTMDWVKLALWCDSVYYESNDMNLKPLDDVVDVSFKRCCDSRGAEDQFGETVCENSIIQWKRLYTSYWRVMNIYKNSF